MILIESYTLLAAFFSVVRKQKNRLYVGHCRFSLLFFSARMFPQPVLSA
jgi:hypothetical protein